MVRERVNEAHSHNGLDLQIRPGSLDIRDNQGRLPKFRHLREVAYDDRRELFARKHGSGFDTPKLIDIGSPPAKIFELLNLCFENIISAAGLSQPLEKRA